MKRLSLVTCCLVLLLATLATPSFSAGTVRYGVWTVDGRNIRRSNLLLLAVVRHLLQPVDRLRDLLGTVGFVNVKRAKEDS